LLDALTGVPDQLRAVTDAAAETGDMAQGAIELSEAEMKRVMASKELVAALEVQIDAEQRLLAAQMESEEATRLVEAALEREAALREAGVIAIDSQREQIEGLVNSLQDLIEARAEDARQQAAARDVADLREEVEQQKRLVAVLGQGEQASKAVQREIARENAIREALADTTAEYSEEVRNLINELFDLAEITEEANREAAKLPAVYEAAARGIQDALADGFSNIFEEGIDGFEDMANSVLDIFKDLASNIAAVLVAEALGIPELLQRLQSGQGLTGTQKLVGAAGIGAVLGGAVGGGGAGAQIGGGIGGAAGFAIGGPIGGAVGAAIGGAVGGLFGGNDEAEKAQKDFRRTIDKYIDAMRAPTIGDPAEDLRNTLLDLVAGFEEAFDETIIITQERADRFNRSIGRRFDLPALEDTDTSGSLEDFVRNLELAGSRLKSGSEEAREFARVLEAAQLSLQRLRIEQAKQTADFTADLESREAVLRGDTVGAVTARLVREQEKELEAARELADQGIITQNQLIRLAQVLDNELAAAIMNVGGTVGGVSAVVNDLQGFMDGLKLGATSILSPVQQLIEARRQFEEIRTRAEMGDVTAGQQLPQVAQQLLDISRQVNASGAGFVADFNEVQDAVSTTQAAFSTPEGREQQMIELQTSSVEKLEQIRVQQEESNRIAMESAVDITDHLNSVISTSLQLVEEIKKRGEVTR